MKRYCMPLSFAGICMAVILTTSSAFGMIPDTIWTKCFGGPDWDYGYDVEQTADGGYIVAGDYWTIGRMSDVFLIKTDSLGDTLWTRKYGGYNSDVAYGVQQTFDGGYVVTGYRTVFDAESWLLKTDANGDTLWTKIYGGSEDDYTFCVLQTADSGYVVVGETESFGVGGEDAWLLRTDKNGDTLWTKTYGGADNDGAYWMRQTPDGDYVLAGYTGGPDPRDGWLIKIDENGDTLWTRSYGGAEDDIFLSLQCAPDGGYICVGNTQSIGAGGYDVWLVKVDSLGNQEWERAYGGMEYEDCYGVDITFDGCYIVTGETESFGPGPGDLWLIKCDAAGDSVWTCIYGPAAGNEWGIAVKMTSDQGYIIVGSTTSFGAGENDIWLLKTEPDLGVVERRTRSLKNGYTGPTIFNGPLLLPEGKQCRVFDITGRVVEPDKIRPGVYFIELEGKISQKVVKVR